MSFHYVPGQFRVPEIPNLTMPNGIWRGAGSDDGLLAFDAGYTLGRIMSRELCYSLKIGGSVLKPVFSSINGYIYWSGSGHVYYTQTYGWVYMTDMFPGYEPVEEFERKDGKIVWSGDRFHTFYSHPVPGGSATALTPRGSIYGREDRELEMTAVWPRWKSVRGGEFGEYEPLDGAEGKRWLGLPRFRGTNYEYFTRSFAKTNGRFTYGRIRYSQSDGKWVIGDVGSSTGWHEGSEPSKDGAVNFCFCRNEGSEAKGTDISVSLYDHVKGDERGKAYLGEVAVWR